MPTIRLKKHEQGLLVQTWPGMPASVRSQLTQESVRNVEIPSNGVEEAVVAITEQRAACHCRARRRRFDTLLKALGSPL